MSGRRRRRRHSVRNCRRSDQTRPPTSRRPARLINQSSNILAAFSAARTVLHPTR